MACSKIYFGDEGYCLIIKKDEDVKDAEFLVFDEDDNPIDLTGTEHKITVYKKPDGAELYTKDFVQNSNSLKWTYKYIDVGLPTGIYYQEMSFIDANSDLKFISFGDFRIL